MMATSNLSQPCVISMTDVRLGVELDISIPFVIFVAVCLQVSDASKRRPIFAEVRPTELGPHFDVLHLGSFVFPLLLLWGPG